MRLESLEARVVLSTTQPAGDGVGLAAVASDNPVQLDIFVNSDPVALPANIGVNADDSTADVFTTDTSGQLSIAPGAAPTLGDFFTTWRTDAGLAGNNPSATFGENELMGNVADATHTVQMFVNGQISTEFDQYALQPGDAIVLVYGSNPVVSLNTNFGPLVLELFPEDAPGTVDNFLNYVNDGDYNNSFFHRSASNFVIQGGGFVTPSTTFTDTSQFSNVPTDPPIVNEPGKPNLRGTVAMAKTSDPDSATSQFFVNLKDNPSLDSPTNSGGFTVFAQVLDMSVADRIAALPINRDNPPPFGELPLSDSGELVVIQSVTGAGRMTGVKYADLNENGTRDVGEPGIADVTVYIDANDNGQFDAGEIATVTDTDGRYVLEVAPGDYTLRAEVTGGQTATQPVAPDSYAVTVQIGRTETDLDFGETNPPVQGESAISGFVYLDQNNDGVRDDGEAGVPGSRITLSGTTDDGDPVSRSAITLNDGSFRFANLPGGVYQLAQTQPAALIDGTDSTSVDGAVAGEDEITNLVLVSGQELAGNLFGEQALKPAYVSVVWFFASSSSADNVFREMIAQGEILAGNDALAQAIRDGAADVPPDQTPPDGTNAPPVAVADAYTVAADTPLDVTAAAGVLANDTDADGDALTAALVDAPANGSVVLDADGSFAYTPDPQFVGTDTFTYTASDGTDTSNTATVTVMVEGSNVFTVTEDSGAGTSVGTIQVDGLTGPLLFEIDDPAVAGDLRLVPDDHMVGDPAASLVLIEYADFQCPACAAIHPSVKDLENQFASELLIVTRHFPLTAIHANAIPAARAAEAAGRQDAFEGMADLLFQNQADWSGAADPVPIFRTYATDLGLDLGQFDADLADPDVDARVQRDLQAAQALGLPGTPSFFLNGDRLDLTGAPNELAGIINSALADVDNAFTVNRTTGEILVTGFTNLNFESTPRHELTVNVTDLSGNRQQIDVVINVTDTAERPVAVDDNYSVDQDSPLTVSAADGVLKNDSDPDGDPIQAVLATATSNGTLSLQNDGSFTYVPDSGFVGTDTFTYQARDAALSSSAATVTITVGDINVAPVAVADAYSVDEGQTLVVDAGGGLLANDTDADGDALSVEVLRQPDHGNLAMELDGSFTYSPEAGFAGTDTFDYRANDGSLVSNAVTVTVTVVDTNQPPVATADQYDVPAGLELTVGGDQGLLVNDTDADGGPLPALQVGRFGNPGHGSLTVDLDGGFTYTPDPDFVGTDTFTYRASDGQKESEETTVTLDVAADQVLAVAAGSSDGTVVGQVAVSGNPAGPLLYDVADPTIPDALRLKADDHLTGAADARAVLVQYVDFQHVAAQSLHTVVRDLQQAFAGDLLTVTRYLPATGTGANALAAAQAAEAAGRQGAFDGMVDKLFAVENWEQWKNAADPFFLFSQYADQLGLDAAQFQSDYADPATIARIQRDIDESATLGVGGAPAFYLDAQSVTLPWTFDAFSARIQGRLDAADDPLVVDRLSGEIKVADGSLLDPATRPVLILPVRVVGTSGEIDTVSVQVNVVDGGSPAVAAGGTAAADAVFAGTQDWRPLG